jgi:hypothetical protein
MSEAGGEMNTELQSEDKGRRAVRGRVLLKRIKRMIILNWIVNKIGECESG